MRRADVPRRKLPRDAGAALPEGTHELPDEAAALLAEMAAIVAAC